MAIYKYDENDGTPAFALTDYPVHGAGRVGNFDKAATIMNYELTDHLGNVRVSVKYAGVSGSQTVAQVQSWNDYYSFGGLMPGRRYTSTAYRFNYQGNEKDLDLNANENWVNFKLRMFNPDLGRWMSPDPYGQFHSPYVGMGNNPVSGVDPDGGFANYYTTASGGAYFGHALQKRWLDQWHWGNVNNPDNFVNDNTWLYGTSGNNQNLSLSKLSEAAFAGMSRNDLVFGASRRGGIYTSSAVYSQSAFHMARVNNGDGTYSGWSSINSDGQWFASYKLVNDQKIYSTNPDGSLHIWQEKANGDIGYSSYRDYLKRQGGKAFSSMKDAIKSFLPNKNNIGFTNTNKIGPEPLKMKGPFGDLLVFKTYSSQTIGGDKKRYNINVETHNGFYSKTELNWEMGPLVGSLDDQGGVKGGLSIFGLEVQTGFSLQDGVLMSGSYTNDLGTTSGFDLSLRPYGTIATGVAIYVSRGYILPVLRYIPYFQPW